MALGLGVVIAVSGLLYARRLRDQVSASRELEMGRLHEERGAAEQERASIVLAAREDAHRLRSESEAEVRERRAEVARLEQRLAQREEGLEKRNRDVEQGSSGSPGARRSWSRPGSRSRTSAPGWVASSSGSPG